MTPMCPRPLTSAKRRRWGKQDFRYENRLPLSGRRELTGASSRRERPDVPNLLGRCDLHGHEVHDQQGARISAGSMSMSSKPCR